MKEKVSYIIHGNLRPGLQKFPVLRNLKRLVKGRDFSGF